MSTALLRQALEFVDPAENVGKPKKRGTRLRDAAGQDLFSETQVELEPEKEKIAVKELKEKDTISKLLKLSQPALDKQTAKKIVKRAATGKPVFDKIKIKKEETKSILFPEDNEKQNKKKSSKKRLSKRN